MIPQTHQDRRQRWALCRTMHPPLMHTVVFLVALGHVCGQADQTVVNARTIPQWLTGLIAVTVFLFLVFAAYMVNRVWNKRAQENLQRDITGKPIGGAENMSNGTYSQYVIHDITPSEHEHAYENPIEVADNVLSTPM